MSRWRKVLDLVLRGTSDATIPFADLCGLLHRLGFDERIRGSHHIFTRDDIAEILNVQPKDGGSAKPYRVRQVRHSSCVIALRRSWMAADVRYEMIIYWSADDQAFVAEVPELAGCAADGPTYAEAVAAAEVAIRQWIEIARELGRPIPEPRGRLIFA